MYRVGMVPADKDVIEVHTAAQRPLIIPSWWIYFSPYVQLRVSYVASKRVS